MTWTAVCRLEELQPERGVAALVGEAQVALFRLLDGTVLGIDHTDPFSGANVMARGIVGTKVVEGEEVPVVTSPMYKQVFDLRTGVCLTDGATMPDRGSLRPRPEEEGRHMDSGNETVTLKTWLVRVNGEAVEVKDART
ncbi:nitrite reductase small subunit NirD [Luteipulveratus mongoliensis]|uniref:Rieske-like [2Fe-2S] domain-containing protein n=1 Tax=Luteipulveratus mongoliensis TaxID=571913 RepID=A0A0K1JG15_9MICO|nr:nitrite reductase small subunit NirD [Luteipulveratus mongoliensis]AKU15528.1 hypothetical protein VV02_06090 [Luteipulveratus mongoliensis]